MGRDYQKLEEKFTCDPAEELDDLDGGATKLAQLAEENRLECKRPFGVMKERINKYKSNAIIISDAIKSADESSKSKFSQISTNCNNNQ